MPEDPTYDEVALEADLALLDNVDVVMAYQKATAYLLEESRLEIWKLLQLAFFIGAKHGVAAVGKGIDDLRNGA